MYLSGAWGGRGGGCWVVVVVLLLMFGVVLVGVLRNSLRNVVGVFGPVFVGFGSCWILGDPVGFQWIVNDCLVCVVIINLINPAHSYGTARIDR